jgi:hypothetical protein
MSKSGIWLSTLSIAGLVCLGGPCRAENIFELIFGGGQHPAKARAAPAASSHHFSSSRRHVAHKRRDPSVADAGESSSSAESMKLSYAEAWGGASDGAGKCCASAVDMIARVTRRDPTLREGDAFMTSDGLRVFVGDRRGDTKFVPVGQAPKLSPALKERLQAMDKTPSASPSRSRAEKASGPLAHSGVAEKAEKDRLIETANGKTIRLVGGFVN